MNAIAEGPIHGSALFSSRPTPASDSTSTRIRPRRQIGTGARTIIVTNPARIASRRIAKPIQQGRAMKRTTVYATSFFAILLSVAALGISAAVNSPRTLMSRADYSEGKNAIEAETRMALAGCRESESSAKDICKSEARAEERVKEADLQARYHGTVAAADEARIARTKAAYDVAKARCGIHKGDERTECLRSAREDNGKALSDAKLAST